MRSESLIEVKEPRVKVYLSGMDARSSRFLSIHGGVWLRNPDGTWKSLSTGILLKGKPHGCYVSGRSRTNNLPFVTTRDVPDHRFCPK